MALIRGSTVTWVRVLTLYQANSKVMLCPSRCSGSGVCDVRALCPVIMWGRWFLPGFSTELLFFYS